MIKMDMIWVAAATLIYPETSSRRMVSESQIENQVARLFDTKITPIMIEKHLVSWEDRQADRSDPSRGGSRNRYLFRSINGMKPSSEGKFRLYKRADGQYDGWDKTGRICPEIDAIPENLQYLLEWYNTRYFPND
jgi:hypothetical protein